MERRKALIAAAAIVAVSAVLYLRFNPSARGVIAGFFRPFLSGGQQISWHQQNLDLYALSKRQLIERLEELEQRLQQRQQAVAERERLRQENARLRRLLQAPPPVRFQAVVAQVLSRDAATAGWRLRINRGAASGIEAGVAVLANEVLLGRVLSVQRHSAVVMTVHDPACKVPVRLPAENHFGLLKGEETQRFLGDPYCRLLYLPRDMPYQAGSVVETSPFSRMLPGGVPVGELQPIPRQPLTSVHKKLYKNSTVRPYVNDERYTFLTVMVPVYPETAVPTPE